MSRATLCYDTTSTCNARLFLILFPPSFRNKSEEKVPLVSTVHSWVSFLRGDLDLIQGNCISKLVIHSFQRTQHFLVQNWCRFLVVSWSSCSFSCLCWALALVSGWNGSKPKLTLLEIILKRNLYSLAWKGVSFHFFHAESLDRPPCKPFWRGMIQDGTYITNSSLIFQ